MDIVLYLNLLNIYHNIRQSDDFLNAYPHSNVSLWKNV